MRVAHYILSAVLLLGTIESASAQPAVATAPPPAGATKICAVFVPNMWRTVTPVPGTWGLDDCRNMGQAVGANTLQVACFFEKEQAGMTAKFVFGGASAITNPPSPANVPSPNCGW
jgi:hypothetical protein